MIEKKSLLKTAIEMRNKYQARLIENMANTKYFFMRKEAAKPDTQERIDAIKSLEDAEQSVKNDTMLMEAFDQVITELMEGKAN